MRRTPVLQPLPLAARDTVVIGMHTHQEHGLHDLHFAASEHWQASGFLPSCRVCRDSRAGRGFREFVTGEAARQELR